LEVVCVGGEEYILGYCFFGFGLKTEKPRGRKMKVVDGGGLREESR